MRSPKSPKAVSSKRHIELILNYYNIIEHLKTLVNHFHIQPISRITHWRNFTFGLEKEMSGGGGESGFSLVELMVVSMILIAIFSGSFLVLKKARDSTSPQSSSGPHLYFESFATSRLKLYFSKLLQWTTQVAPFCDGASYFAYAGNRTSAGRELETLGADIRMSLSTLSFGETVIPTASLAGRFDEERDIPWGMMVPFDSRSDLIGGISNIQPALRSFCGANDAGASNDRTDGDVVAEMCAWVDVCSAQ
ncbi:MAG: hypothetical protein RJB13_2565, partial [Pseudomonadota bacterium]